MQSAQAVAEILRGYLVLTGRVSAAFSRLLVGARSMRHQTPAALLLCVWLSAVDAQVVSPSPGRAPAPAEPPQHVIAAFGGQLRGVNKGEWGGSLTFHDRDGHVRQLLQTNVVGMYETPSAVIVFTGLSHLSTNEGAIYTVRAIARDRPEVTLLHRLAGAPSGLDRPDRGVITFRVFTGKFEPATDQPPRIEGQFRSRNAQPVFACQALSSELQLLLVPCSTGTR